jgi:hypothetical protein
MIVGPRVSDPSASLLDDRAANAGLALRFEDGANVAAGPTVVGIGAEVEAQDAAICLSGIAQTGGAFRVRAVRRTQLA